MSTLPKVSGVGLIQWSDERLVKECMNGNQDAWNSMLGRYRKLIYSVPIRYGLSTHAADDIFQQVCLQLLDALPNLREPKSLAAWLIKVTARGCFQWAGREGRFQSFDFEAQPENGPVAQEMPETLLREFERMQILREALSEIPPRCREIFRMLFFETPAVSYEEVAKKLGIAKGSIGFIRMRCLKRLRKRLEERRFS